MKMVASILQNGIGKLVCNIAKKNWIKMILDIVKKDSSIGAEKLNFDGNGW